MVDPQPSLLLLENLEKLGFDNGAFAALHHFKEKGRADTISAHRAYCNRTSGFQEGSANSKVQLRLKLVLAAYLLGGFESGRPEVFKALAEAAYEKIQYLS